MNYTLNNRELNSINYSISQTLSLTNDELKSQSPDSDLYETLTELKKQLEDLEDKFDSSYTLRKSNLK